MNFSQEEMKFNTTEIARILNISICSVTKFTRILKLNPEIVSGRTHAYLFNWHQFKQLEKYVANNKKIQALRRDKNTLNEDAQEHPLVTDKRCLNLYYWPDVIPDCFKDMEE